MAFSFLIRPTDRNSNKKYISNGQEEFISHWYFHETRKWRAHGLIQSHEFIRISGGTIARDVSPQIGYIVSSPAILSVNLWFILKSLQPSRASGLKEDALAGA
jgi:hypothetical protein